MDYERLLKLIRGEGEKLGLEMHTGYLGDVEAPGRKPQVHLYGKKEVSIRNRKPQKTYVAGIIQQKGFVGFYAMPIYSHPQKFTLSPALQKAQKGKSCFHIKRLDDTTEKELRELLLKGVELYRTEGWI